MTKGGGQECSMSSNAWLGTPTYLLRGKAPSRNTALALEKTHYSGNIMVLNPSNVFDFTEEAKL